MSTTESIMRHLSSLPEPARREVLDFVEFLKSQRDRVAARRDDTAWSGFSLESAMRGMEEEISPYSLSDLKERFE